MVPGGATANRPGQARQISKPYSQSRGGLTRPPCTCTSHQDQAISMHMQLLAQSRPHEKPHAWIGTRRQRARGSSRSHAPSVHPAGWHLVLSLGARPAARDPCARARVRRSAMRRRRAVHARRHRWLLRVSRRVWSMWLVIARTRESIRSIETNERAHARHACMARPRRGPAGCRSRDFSYATRPAGHVSAMHGIYHRRRRCHQRVRVQV